MRVVVLSRGVHFAVISPGACGVDWIYDKEPRRPRGMGAGAIGSFHRNGGPGMSQPLNRSANARINIIRWPSRRRSHYSALFLVAFRGFGRNSGCRSHHFHNQSKPRARKRLLFVGNGLHVLRHPFAADDCRFRPALCGHQSRSESPTPGDESPVAFQATSDACPAFARTNGH